MREQTLKAKMLKEQVRTITQISERMEVPKGAFWLSFVGEGDGFRGVVIVHAEDFLTAIMECNLRGINPHGQCQGMEIPAEKAAQIPDKWKNRILTREECAAFDEEMLSGSSPSTKEEK